jgi:hypothetical protein
MQSVTARGSEGGGEKPCHPCTEDEGSAQSIAEEMASKARDNEKAITAKVEGLVAGDTGGKLENLAARLKGAPGLANKLLRTQARSDGRGQSLRQVRSHSPLAAAMQWPFTSGCLPTDKSRRF